MFVTNKNIPQKKRFVNILFFRELHSAGLYVLYFKPVSSCFGQPPLSAAQGVQGFAATIMMAPAAALQFRPVPAFKNGKLLHFLAQQRRRNGTLQFRHAEKPPHRRSFAAFMEKVALYLCSQGTPNSPVPVSGLTGHLYRSIKTHGIRP